MTKLKKQAMQKPIENNQKNQLLPRKTKKFRREKEYNLIFIIHPFNDKINIFNTEVL